MVLKRERILPRICAIEGEALASLCCFPLSLVRDEMIVDAAAAELEWCCCTAVRTCLSILRAV